MLVWRSGFQLDGDKVLFLDKEQIEIEDKTFNQFKWDKPNRLDVPHTNSILFVFDDEKTCDAFGTGFYTCKHLLEMFEGLKQYGKAESTGQEDISQT